MLVGGLTSLEEKLLALEKESVSWNVHLQMGDEGKNLMDHSMLVWCCVCRSNSIVSFETYSSAYTLPAASEKDNPAAAQTSVKTISTKAKSKPNSVVYYSCPVSYYASVLLNKDMYLVKKWHWDGVESSMHAMKALYNSTVFGVNNTTTTTPMNTISKVSEVSEDELEKRIEDSMDCESDGSDQDNALQKGFSTRSSSCSSCSSPLSSSESSSESSENSDEDSDQDSDEDSDEGESDNSTADTD